MHAQAKRKKKEVAAGDDTDDPVQTNRFSASNGVLASVGALMTVIVCNAAADPAISMFPEPDDFRDKLWDHIDDDPKLNTLLVADDAENQEAFREVGHITYDRGARELALLVNMCSWQTCEMTSLMQLPCRRYASHVRELPLQYWEEEGLKLFRLRYNERTQGVLKLLVSFYNPHKHVHLWKPCTGKGSSQGMPLLP